MRTMGVFLLMISAFMTVFTDRRQASEMICSLDSFSAAFRQLARELRSTGAPMRRLLRQLPEGPASRYLSQGQKEGLEALGAEQRSLVEQTCGLLGRFDVETQAIALIRAAEQLERERETAVAAFPAQLRARRAMILSGAAVVAILLL